MKHTAKNILVGTIGAAGLFLASTATANADTTHTVAKNDTVWDLSQKYGVSIQSIEKLNNIDQNTHLIVTGQTLKVPASNSSTENTSSEENTSADTENTTDVTVQSGDTLWDLAQKYGTTVAKLRELNGLSADTTLIYPGKVLKVNGTAQATQSTTTATTTTADQTTAATTQDTTAQDTTTQATQDTTAQQTTQETQTPQVTVSANHTTYTVQAGDSLYSIAQAYGVTVDSLRSANTLGATLAVGQTLTINDPTKDPSATQQATQDTTAQTQTTQQAAQDTTAQQTQQQQATQNTTTTQSQQTQQAAQSTTTTQSQQTQQAAQSTTTTQSQQTQATQSTQQTTTTTTASSVSGSAIAAYAQTFIGVPYVWGGTTPSGFDCSGLTQYVYAHFGKQIGRNTIAQESAGTRIPVSQAQVGDLLFWGSAGSTYHVAIYLGGNSYIAAPEPGQSVKVGNMAYFMPSFAVHVN
ncbi:C40 family peptidase [Ligilactobacillus apodemi]|uniref:Cell wall-associated hydrolase n=1 Tax=Ligilactobacillus apodemi DSM 16634 = JCM 16172 TaxID=1423724 RepID=A0A0R1TYK6_9LACO|nr:C40 family peptidase [Ligilactobacillus apodemi]KRL86214.1 cell wall-associated hydrolase [Ligilactobacillus apodemi DSM 16634 = JCM 16172]